MTPYIPYHLKTQNRQFIYNIFQERKLSSRAEIVRLTGISFPTVLKTVDKLLELGILTELEEQEQLSGAGRRGHLLQFNPDSYTAIGVQFDGRCAHLGLVNLDGKIHHSFTLPCSFNLHRILTSKLSPNETSDLHKQLSDISDSIQYLYEENLQKKIPVLGIGIGFPSMIQPETKSILHINEFGITQEFPFHSVFPTFTNSLPLPYYIGNDVNLACQGEAFLRNLLFQKSNLLYITLGNGCGAGILQNGNLWYGSKFRSGEIGHMPSPTSDCFYSSDTQIQTLESQINLNALYEKFQIHLEQTPNLWEKQPSTAQKICDYICPYLVHLMLTVGFILDIHLCVVTGPIAEALGSGLLEKTQNLLSQLHYGDLIQLVPPIQRTSGITGAAVCVLQESFEELLNK